MFEYGFIVSADALGQMIFSPIFGLMADKLNSIRLVSLICCITFSLGNLFYANISVVPKTLGSIPLARMYALILARFIVGNVVMMITLSYSFWGAQSRGKNVPDVPLPIYRRFISLFTCVITLYTSSHFIGPIHLFLMGGPSVEYVIYKNFLFFIRN